MLSPSLEPSSAVPGDMLAEGVLAGDAPTPSLRSAITTRLAQLRQLGLPACVAALKASPQLVALAAEVEGGQAAAAKDMAPEAPQTLTARGSSTAEPTRTAADPADQLDHLHPLPDHLLQLLTPPGESAPPFSEALDALGLDPLDMADELAWPGSGSGSGSASGSASALPLPEALMAAAADPEDLGGGASAAAGWLADLPRWDLMASIDDFVAAPASAPADTALTSGPALDMEAMGLFVPRLQATGLLGGLSPAPASSGAAAIAPQTPGDSALGSSQASPSPAAAARCNLSCAPSSPYRPLIEQLREAREAAHTAVVNMEAESRAQAGHVRQAFAGLPLAAGVETQLPAEAPAPQLSVAQCQAEIEDTICQAMAQLRTTALPERRRRSLPKAATRILLAWYNEHYDSPYPSEADKAQLSQASGVTPEQVSTWMSNHRNRDRSRSAASGGPRQR